MEIYTLELGLSWVRGNEDRQYQASVFLIMGQVQSTAQNLARTLPRRKAVPDETLAGMSRVRLSLVLQRWKIQLRSWFQPIHYWTWFAVALWPIAEFAPHYLAKPGHSLPVGVLTVFLGVLAAAVTLRDRPSRLEKAAWIVLLTIIMSSEIRNFYTDRDEHNAQALTLLNALNQQGTTLGEQGQTLSGMAKNIQLSFDSITSRESALTKSLNTIQSQSVHAPPQSAAAPPSPGVVVIKTPYGNLRERALQLSQQLYGLVGEEQQDIQEKSAGATPSTAEAISHEAVVRMSERYFDLYDVQVRQIMEDFAKVNLRNTELQEIMRSISALDKVPSVGWRVNGAMVNQIARGLTNLASQIPAR